MPAQTSLKSKIRFPDGCKVSVKEYGAGSYTDIGALGSDVNLTLNYDENKFETANAGELETQIKNMMIDGSFTLIHLDTANINRLGGGIFELVTNSGGVVATIDDQVIASGAATDKTPYNLEFIETGATALKSSAEPTITSVTGATDGALTANDDYTIIPDSNSPSGYSIVFNTAGATLTTLAQVITIVYTSVTSIASTELYAGTSSKVLTALALKFTHTDEDSNIDAEFELYSASPNSGGFQFNFKAATADGVEEMPITFTGKPDTTRTDGRQLFRYFDLT